MDGVLSRKIDLNFECPREIRERIADEIIDEWDSVGRALDVSDKKLKSIRDNSSLTLPKEKAVALLDAWAEEYGSRATCLKLAEALHRRKSVREILCDEVTQMKHETTMPSGAGAAVCLKPSDNQQQVQGHDIEPDNKVVTRIEELESRFLSLQENVLSELESKKVTAMKLLDSLTLLPVELSLQYRKTIPDMLPDLRRQEKVSGLFFHLNPLISFIDYSLIKHIIDEFGSDTLKKEMNDYSKDVVQFMKKTTVKQLVDHWPGQQDIPPNFSKLLAKLDQDLNTYTLYELDQLRKRYCCELKLSEVVFTIIGLKTSL